MAASPANCLSFGISSLLFSVDCTFLQSQTCHRQTELKLLHHEIPVPSAFQPFPIAMVSVLSSICPLATDSSHTHYDVALDGR